eukprot:1137893-Pelagomonas_calceolata.AAC.4
MQIAMTFNVGLFCAVILGYVLGVFFFASFPENYAMHLQMMTPPKTSVDCECPSNMDKVVKEVSAASAMPLLRSIQAWSVCTAGVFL